MKVAVMGLCLFCLTASAQRDTSRLDLGWMSLDRNLTQTITVKGSDLEKMPFMDLAEALRAWCFGANTSPGSMVYVVDGNPVTDVSMYPIYEIEKVELVQHATGAAAYGSGQRWLAVVTTKRGAAKRGLRLVAQAGPVNSHGNGLHTTTNVFHHYYAGANERLDKVEYGVSADWIRDVAPTPFGNVAATQYHVQTPLEARWWRFNGYMRWMPAKGQSVELTMGYAPQVVDQHSDSVQTNASYQTYYGTDRDLRGHLVLPRLTWRADLLPGLRQELAVGYVSAGYDLSQSYYDSSLNSSPRNVFLSQLYARQRATQLYFNERLGYLAKAGEWCFRPAVNLYYNHIDEKGGYTQSSVGFTGFGSGPLVLLPAPPLDSLRERKGDVLYLTPSVDIGFGRAIDLVAGVRVNLRNGEDAVSKVVYPFASVSVDVLGLGKGMGSSLKLFGSYAQRAQVYLDDYSSFDLAGGGAGQDISAIYRVKTFPTNFGSIPLHYPATLWSWQAGVAFALPGDRFRVSYNFERRNFNTPYYIAFIGNSADNSYAYVPYWQSDLHHLDLRMKVKDGKGFEWETGFGLTGTRNKAIANVQNVLLLATVYELYITYPQGERTPDKYSWTGGWVNRIHAGGFELGLDILYHFGEHPYIANGYGGFLLGPRVNSVMTPNFYVGYQWKLPAGKTLGVFAASRGLARSKSSDLPDSRRYYTLGVKFGL
jgi:hypothetical protein